MRELRKRGWEREGAGLKRGRACDTFWQVKRKKYGVRNSPSNARQPAGKVSKANIRVKPSRKRKFIAVGIALAAIMGAVAFIVIGRCFKAEPPPVTAGNRVDFEMLELKDRRRKLEALNSGFGIQESHITLTEAQRDRAQFELAEMMRLPRTPQLEAAIAQKRQRLEVLRNNVPKLEAMLSRDRVQIPAALKELELREKAYMQRKRMTPEQYAAGCDTDPREIRFCESLEKKVSQPDYDIADLSMTVMQGLPGTEQVDVAKVMKTLDAWAGRVRSETERNLHRYRENPKEYENSEAYFRVLMMGTVLQQDFKVRYNPDPEKRSRPVMPSSDDLSFYNDTRDVFLYGLLSDAPQGTCASMPVLYAAVGRRLGYPLKFVNAKDHWFLRWEGAHERFNIECTSDRGLNCYPDAEYMEWPYPISKQELATGMYLKSLTPKKDLASLLNLRSICLDQAGRKNQGLTCKLYADELLLKAGVDLKTVNAGIAKQKLDFAAKSWRGKGDERTFKGNPSVVAIERF